MRIIIFNNERGMSSFFFKKRGRVHDRTNLVCKKNRSENHTKLEKQGKKAASEFFLQYSPISIPKLKKLN
jgi:hypothetical protein